MKLRRRRLSSTRTPNARFWTWHKGWVKITLKPGKSLQYYHSEPTEEGYSFDGYTWTHNHDRVTRDWCNGGRDCDGPIRRSGEDECLLSRLSSIEPYTMENQPQPELDGVPIFRPEWEEAQATRVYDAYAQAMNY